MKIAEDDFTKHVNRKKNVLQDGSSFPLLSVDLSDGKVTTQRMLETVSGPVSNVQSRNFNAKLVD